MNPLPENGLQALNAYRSQVSLAPILSESQTRLHEWLTYDEIEELRLIFKNAPEQKFDYNEFRQLLLKFNIYLSNDDYDTLFAKINTNRDSHIDWDEFISHLILGFREDDPYNQKEALINPISLTPEIKKSGHRHPIVNIKRVSTMLPDRTVKKGTGGYITVSKEGTVNFWSGDLEIQRSGVSKNPYFKVAQTCILAVSSLPDVRIVCTASSERDLRFYDTTAINFHLRIIINSLPWAVNCTHYHFQKSIQQTCKLVLGDFGGNVRLIEFYPELRGPFQNKPGTALIEMSWADLLRGRLPQMRVREYLNIHIDVVREVRYSEYLNSIFSVAEGRSSAISLCPAMASIDLGAKKSIYKFYTAKGITTFSLDDDNLIVATGGPECLVRLWNPLVPQKPIGILSGHHAGIVFVFLQSDERKVYSIDHHKVIKVWDVNEQSLLQTFIGLQQLIPRRVPFVCYYNTENHELLIGTRKLISIKCCPLLRMDSTDGETHAGPVSVVLYNTLFKSVVTCGLDSFVIIWDPWTGKRLTLIKNAHVRVLHGKSLRVEITSACFDPMQQLLLTGARDGSLKVWNFNSGICMRNLSIEAMCEVTTVFWIRNRILAIGWNRHVTEFADIEGQEYSDGKNWETLHDEDVLCAAIREPEVLATGSYSGSVILWKLETGQPYRQYNVAHPTQFIKIVFGKQTKPLPKIDAKKEAEKSRYPKFEKRRESIEDTRPYTGSSAGLPKSRAVGQFSSYVGAPRYRRLSVIQMPIRSAIMRPLSIQSMIFLKTRPASKEHGTLLVALEDGIIQVYSHHNLGGFMEQFSAIHMPGDCIVAMETDEKNRYLFTATAFGYIKTWLMTNFCVPESEQVRICMPKLRLRFPFLLRDRFDGRAKRSARGQIFPMLLNSYKAHLRPISSLQYIDRSHILISGSSDNTTRLWSLGGRYLGTLGTPLTWLKLSPSEPVLETDNYRMPPDIAKVASSTTLKVLTGAKPERFLRIKTTPIKDTEEATNMTTEPEAKVVYGKPLTEPILGKHFKLPVRGRPHLKPTLDKTLPYIPVYAHLDIHKAKPIERPPTPEALKRTRELDFYENPK